MAIYGVSILAICYIVGQFIGDILGSVLNVDANVGGVGFAMLLLILVTGKMKKSNLLKEESEKGILFWSAMYIPIVVAMTATQNVVSAISGGLAAILTGVLSVIACFLLIPLITKLSNKNSNISEKGAD